VRKLSALFVLALLVGGCQASGELIGRTISISDEATLSDPQASLEMDDLAASRDRILLNFWGSWSVPCRDEIPLLAAYAASAAPQATVVGVLYKDAAGPAAAAAEQLGATWANLVDEDGAIAGQIPVNAAPLTLLLNASGEVLDYQVGPFASLEEIDAFVSGK
jgi:cytochrome c biogenesis protein CcmG/thiol:disulfide interchange protein DsbE